MLRTVLTWFTPLVALVAGPCTPPDTYAQPVPLQPEAVRTAIANVAQAVDVLLADYATAQADLAAAIARGDALAADNAQRAIELDVAQNAASAATARAIEAEARAAAAEAARFAPWPDTTHYFGAISNIPDGDPTKAQPGELCLGINLSNRSGQIVNGMQRPIYADPSPLKVRYFDGRDKAAKNARMRSRSGSLTTVYRAAAVPLSIPSEGDGVTLTKPTIAQYPNEPRDYVHPDDLPALVARAETMMRGESFFFWDNSGGHERHGAPYGWTRTCQLIADTVAAGTRYGCRCVFNVVYRPDLGQPDEWAQLAAAIGTEHAVMFEWLPDNLETARPCVQALLDAGCVVVLSGDPTKGAAWVKTFPAGAKLYQCRNPFDNSAAYLAMFRR